MNDTNFWGMIESAWEAAVIGGALKSRQKLAAGKLSQSKAEDLQNVLEEVIPILKGQLDRLSVEDLLTFDRILEQKLYAIDREDIHEYMDGSDDGFLYARGFIVAAGQEYYDAVLTKPSTALMELECEEMCYLSWHLYEEKFGDMPLSEISRESCSNKAGWPSLTQ